MSEVSTLTNEQQRELVAAAFGADYGCIYCVGPLLATYRRVFPDVDWDQPIRDHCRSSYRRAYTVDEYLRASHG